MSQKSSVPQAVSFVSQVLKRDTKDFKRVAAQLWVRNDIFVQRRWSAPREVDSLHAAVLTVCRA